MLQLPFIFFYMGCLALANPHLPATPLREFPVKECRITVDEEE